MKKVIGGAYLVSEDYGLTFRKGDVVILRECDESPDWVLVEINGGCYRIDTNHLEFIEGDAPIDSEDEPSKPAHYDTGIDTIAFLRANCPPEQVEGFLRGNAIKYLQRYAAKGTPIEDLKKSRHYIDMLIEELEGRE